MTANRKRTSRLYLLILPIGFVALRILIELGKIQFVEGDSLRMLAAEQVVRNIEIPASRGSIWSRDGKFLSTNMPVYKVYMDPTVASDKLYANGIEELSIGLEKYVGNERTAFEWNALLTSARKNNNRFVTISRSMDHSGLQALKSLPVLKEGRFKGGLIALQVEHRKQPLGKVARRTIGSDAPYSKFGLEYAYSLELSGTSGSRLAQKISGGQWKPLTDFYSSDPEDGMDLISTIDSRLQDITHHALLGALERHDADHGCAVLMEVKTGAIRAIANLGRNSEESGYYEKRNYAVWERTEPGSTFKTIALMAALEDGRVDTSMRIDTENGSYEVLPGIQVKDSNVKNGLGGYGVISLGEALERSSNTAIVKALYAAYQEDPQQFVDRLYALGLDQKLGLDIQGESMPVIPTPGDDNWSGMSLPWMLFGYEVSFTPLQILSMYNAIANNGILNRPRFVERLERMGEVEKEMKPEVIHPSLCSEETLDQLKHLLEEVVCSPQGTAHNIYSPDLPIAGKTGTCQLDYWMKDKALEYQASFVGYFPADAPLYSCIVVVNKPSSGGYYGSVVAAPVFKEIARGVNRLRPVRAEGLPSLAAKETPIPDAEAILQEVEAQRMPDLRGMRLSDAIALMENQGFEVRLDGFAGKVIGQWPQGGKSLPNGRIIRLEAG